MPVTSQVHPFCVFVCTCAHLQTTPAAAARRTRLTMRRHRWRRASGRWSRAPTKIRAAAASARSACRGPSRKSCAAITTSSWMKLREVVIIVVSRPSCSAHLHSVRTAAVFGVCVWNYDSNSLHCTFNNNQIRPRNDDWFLLQTPQNIKKCFYLRCISELQDWTKCW